MDDGDEPIDPGHVWVELGSCRQQREPDQERSDCANLLYERKTTVSREKPFQPGWIYSTVTDASNWKPPFEVFRIDPFSFILIRLVKNATCRHANSVTPHPPSLRHTVCTPHA